MSHAPRAAGLHWPSARGSWLLAAFVLLALRVQAQDIHFSQFFNAPYSLSPGNIGAFDGQYRIGGIFRQQWRSVTTPYRTFGLGGDAADLAGVRGLGGGAWLYNDRAGDSHLNTFHLSLGGSWTKKFGTSQEQSLTGGLQIGFTSVSIDYSALRFDAQYNGFYYDPSMPNDEQFARNGLSHPDVHTGLVYRYTPSERDLIQVGLSLFNLTRPNVAFNDAVASPLDMRNVFHVITRFPVSNKVDVQPMLQYMGQAKFRELDLGGTVRYILLDRYTYLRTVQAGVFWRASDAGYVFVGSEYDDWTVGLSYDINFSDLVPASRNRGGIELTAVRVFRRKPMVPARFKACPTQL
jgi:type IX secretion system PorP/SprF family membrane protein